MIPWSLEAWSLDAFALALVALPVVIIGCTVYAVGRIVRPLWAIRTELDQMQRQQLAAIEYERRRESPGEAAHGEIPQSMFGRAATWLRKPL